MTQRPTRSARSYGVTSLASIASIALVALSSIASAQVVVVRLDPNAEPVSEALEAGLTAWGVVPDPGYYQEASNEGLNPSSDLALERLIPPIQARLALVPRAGDDESVLIEFRDGTTGASLGDATIPLEGGAVGSTGQRMLDAEISGRLGVPPPAAGEGEAGPPESATDEALRALVRIYGGAGVGVRNF